MPDLRSLWKLHLVDAAIQEIRIRAANLDVGQRILQELKGVEAQYAEAHAKASALNGELADLELLNKGLEQKIEKFTKDLFGGKLMSSREAETMQKEIEALKRQRALHDERILELWETAPPAKAIEEELQRKIDEMKAAIAQKRAAAVKYKAALEEDFKKKSAMRIEALKAVDAGLLAQYDKIKQRAGGIGMAQLDKDGRCGACGTNQPTKTIESAKEGRLVHCEECNRLLYYTEGLV